MDVALSLVKGEGTEWLSLVGQTRRAPGDGEVLIC